MDEKTKDTYISILREELVPAMGCTEPISIAYAVAKARETLQCMPTRATLQVSGNIVKNAKSVVVPHTGGLRGLRAAFAAGLVAGRADNGLEALSFVKEEELGKIAETEKNFPLEIVVPETCRVFDITVTLFSGEHSALVRIADQHTNIVRMERDGELLFSKEAEKEDACTDRSGMSVKGILEFAQEVDLACVRDILSRQIAYNMAIAEEGLHGKYGANIGKVLLRSYQPDVKITAKAYSAAASDARMNGCELPVVINSGSGNQGVTASVPVIVYARALHCDEEKLYRALCVSNLVTIHLKTGIGTLSAYCGAVSAGAGAACGICYLLGGGYEEISHTLVNALAIDSGIICDGAKASCAAKIATAVESGLLGLSMEYNGNNFYGGDGIVKQDVEETIRSVSRLAYRGMRETDREILRIMLDK